MNVKGTVRLKVLILLLCSVIYVRAAPSTDFGRLDTEAEEKYWVRNLIRIADEIKKNGTNIKSEVEEDPSAVIVVSTDFTPTVPGILCAHYDDARCQKLGECEVTMEKCEPLHHLQVIGCHAVFAWPQNLETNSTEEHLPVPNVEVKNLGCMQYQHVDQLNCVEPDKCRQGDISRGGIGMCCCTTDTCNNFGKIEMFNPALKKEEIVIINAPRGNGDDYLDFSLLDYPILEVNSTYSWSTCFMILILICGVLAVIVAAFFAFKKRREKVYMQMKAQSSGFQFPFEDLEAGGTSPLFNKSLFEKVEDPEDAPVSDFITITKGRFGDVFKATLTDEHGNTRSVAVKKFNKLSEPSYKSEKAIYDELKKLPKWYPGVLQMLLTKEFANECWIVLEYHERLSLYDLIKSTPISLTTANRFILTMLDGLQFLHDDRPYFFGHTKPAIIHRDIKSKNILVKNDMTCCIADFGLARVFKYDIHKSDLLGQVGTRRYMSPEMLQGATDFDPPAFKAMDVYSMGLVVWEVLQRTKLDPDDNVPPYQLPYEEAGIFPTIGAIRNYVNSGKQRPQYRPKLMEHEYASLMAKVTFEMWDYEQCGRITAGCAFARFWNIVMKNFEGSEGYASGDSGDDKKGDDKKDNEKKDNEHPKENKDEPKEEPNETTGLKDSTDSGNVKDMSNAEDSRQSKQSSKKPYDPKDSRFFKYTNDQKSPGRSDDMEILMRWHKDPRRQPHPSQDPFKDDCPNVPELPEFTGAGFVYPPYFYEKGPGDEEYKPLPPEAYENDYEETGASEVKERVFDFIMNRFLSPEEQEVWEAEQNKAKELRNGMISGMSTPTPSASYF